MKGLLAVLAALLFTAPSTAACTGTGKGKGMGTGTGTEPAVWASQKIIVDLHNLPRRYSCDDLWYKFRAVLFAIGARPTQLLPYRCQGTAGEEGFSPQVQLTFYTPQLAQGPAAQTPDVQARRQTVRLAPGAQPHLDAGDCELLLQMKDTLFRYLGDRIPEFSLPCGAPTDHTPPFSLTVDALVPVQDSNQTAHSQTAQPHSANAAKIVVATSATAAQPRTRSSSTARGT